MANPKHLRMLKRRVEVWNEWREDNPGLKPDISKAYLTYRKLGGANLRYVDFEGADLGRVVLSGADLTGANLRWVNLGASTLRRANFREANLEGANLWGADLHEADLTGANLSGAVLMYVENLKLKQLFVVETLYKAELKPSFLTRIKNKYPHLLEKPYE